MYPGRPNLRKGLGFTIKFLYCALKYHCQSIVLFWKSPLFKWLIACLTLSDLESEMMIVSLCNFSEDMMCSIRPHLESVWLVSRKFLVLGIKLNFSLQKLLISELNPVSLNRRMVLMSGVRVPKSTARSDSWIEMLSVFSEMRCDRNFVPVRPPVRLKIHFRWVDSAVVMRSQS